MMASPTSKKTSWLREKLARKISGNKLEQTNDFSSSEQVQGLVECVPIDQYKKERFHDPFEEGEEDDLQENWEVLTLAKHRPAMDSNHPDGVLGQGANKPNRRNSSSQGKMSSILSSPILGGRTSSVGNRSALKQDKKSTGEMERPVSAGAALHRGTGKKKLLSVDSTTHQSSRTPSPSLGLERNSSQRSSLRRKSKENSSDVKSSSPGPRDPSPVDDDVMSQGGAFSKVRDTLRIRKGKKKKGSSTKVAYSVPELSLPNKYQDPFEPDFSENGDKMDEGSGHEFSFVSVPHYHPEYCDYCQQAAWGHHQVLKCASKYYPKYFV